MTFIVCVYKSNDFVRSQQNFAQSNYVETVTFRNSGIDLTLSDFTGVKPELVQC